MTRKVTLLVALILFITVAKAQKKSIEYGVSGGVNINNATGNITAKNITGFNIGGLFKINTSAKFGIKTGLFYDQMGWSYRSLVLEDFNGNLVNGDVFFKLNYLNLPFVAVVTFGNKIKINIEGGVFGGLLLNNKFITELHDVTTPGRINKTETSSSSYKSTNWGFLLGTGLQIPIGHKLKIDVGIQNKLGMSGIYKQNLGNTKQKLNSLCISSGLTYVI